MAVLRSALSDRNARHPFERECPARRAELAVLRQRVNSGGVEGVTEHVDLLENDIAETAVKANEQRACHHAYRDGDLLVGNLAADAGRDAASRAEDFAVLRHEDFDARHPGASLGVLCEKNAVDKHRLLQVHLDIDPNVYERQGFPSDRFLRAEEAALGERDLPTVPAVVRREVGEEGLISATSKIGVSPWEIRQTSDGDTLPMDRHPELYLPRTPS